MRTPMSAAWGNSLLNSDLAHIANHAAIGRCHYQRYGVSRRRIQWNDYIDLVHAWKSRRLSREFNLGWDPANRNQRCLSRIVCDVSAAVAVRHWRYFLPEARGIEESTLATIDRGRGNSD